MGKLLGQVVEQTRDESGGTLSAIVAYIDRNDAGPGFYKLAMHLRVLPPSATAETAGRSASDPFPYDDSLLHDRVSRTDPYGCGAGFSTLNTAPCGSVKTADRPTDGMSNGSTMTCPPPSAALVAAASASSTVK